MVRVHIGEDMFLWVFGQSIGLVPGHHSEENGDLRFVADPDEYYFNGRGTRGTYHKSHLHLLDVLGRL